MREILQGAYGKCFLIPKNGLVPLPPLDYVMPETFVATLLVAKDKLNTKMSERWTEHGLLMTLLNHCTNRSWRLPYS